MPEWGMRPLFDTGGFEFRFPDSNGDALYLRFIPDVANTQFLIEAGYVNGGGPVTTTLNLS